MRQKVEIEVDVPDGWRAVAYRVPLLGEWILTSAGPTEVTCELECRWLILEKVEPKRESRWVPTYEKLCGYESLAKAEASAVGTHRIERLDYEDGKLVAVTLEPEGEVQDE